MKALKLTKKHRSKLLEMCKVLFPDLYSNNTSIFDIRGGDDDTWCIMHYDNKVREWNIIIHWFEFCMVKLPEKLFNTYYEEYQDGAMYYDFMNKFLTYTLFSDFKAYEIGHPIDYLYSEFKKLEKL